MFRRKTRNSTAYTGVGLASPSAQAPDNSAMAAALTIGQNLKNTRPDLYGKPNATLLMSKYQQPKPTLSLLKRSSSIQNSISSGPSAKPSRAGLNMSNRHSMSVGDRHVYNVDDSFNDSFFEEVGRETDAHYSNEMQLKNLKLHHTPQVSQPKMVKKYIPTPNGITVVEVPEETLKKDIARSNSMRSNLSLKRSSLFAQQPRSHSMANSARSRRPNRVSSLVSTSRIDEQTEDDYHSAYLSRGAPRASRELEELQRQIEHEKQLAKDLERQRAEYEQLKRLRLENERKLIELHSLQEEDTSSFRAVSSIEEKELVSETTTTSDHMKIDGANSEIDEQSEEENLSENDEDEDVPIAPVAFKVDELDLKKAGAVEQNGKIIGNGEPHSIDNLDLASSPDAPAASAEFIPLANLVKTADSVNPKETADNFGIEEVPTESFESPNLASQLRPSFVKNGSIGSESERAGVSNISYEFGAFPDEVEDPAFTLPSAPVPEIVESHDAVNERAYENNKSLVPPPSFAGSIRSFSSVDSKSRPIKSAMKSTRPISSTNDSSQGNPAHQAYLSLTTAENTRLNSKLSSTHLDDGSAPEPKPQPPRSPNNQLKRLSQSLRKQPSATSQNGLAGRSLRPQSMADGQFGRNQGMSSRIKPVVQPIPPHPASKPNYQSPSKLKAAELYAKANRRPMSYQATPRTSSFTKDTEASQKTASQVPQKKTHRMTLRSPQPVSTINNVSAQASETHPSTQHSTENNFRSKFADSDDEHETHGGNSQGFLSRFLDSDDEGPRVLTNQRLPEPSAGKTLRNKEDRKKQAEEPEHKEKKPKKKFLKKLFGRS